MKKTRDGYILNVDKHRWICVLCPSFISKSLAVVIKKMLKLARKRKE